MIAEYIVSALRVIVWMGVQIVILIVLIRYGKPLESDTKKLLAQKIEFKM